ncbi:hypothetical protein IJG76_00985 [Candidatus Saccharibacteria bacterium]|nr:hypothetical protein [Candidatus Saccharibacteria bacterium]
MTDAGGHISEKYDKIRRRVRVADYLSVAQIYLKDNFALERPLVFGDVKPRLLGHFGTCHGINVAYANLRFSEYFKMSDFVLGPGHGFPALNANLFLDQKLAEVDERATLDYDGMAHLCREFSWPGGFPSHASPMTPGVITEGGELGYALGAAFGLALGHPEKNVAVLIGDGELETATALASLNLVKLLGGPANGKVWPILHLNGYKISGPTIYGRKSDHELGSLFRGFGYMPIFIQDDTASSFQTALLKARGATHPFLILKSEKGFGSPKRHQDAHQVPLKNPKNDPKELKMLEKWLALYHFKMEDLYD